MIEFTAVELALLCWAVLMTVATFHFKGLADERRQLLRVQRLERHPDGGGGGHLVLLC